MPRDSKSFEVDGPVEEVFRQWARLENLKPFAPGLREARWLTDRIAHFVTDVEGQAVEWQAEISPWERDHTITWRGVWGIPNQGVARFEPAGTGRTRVTIDYEYERLAMPTTEGEEAPEMAQASATG